MNGIGSVWLAALLAGLAGHSPADSREKALEGPVQGDEAQAGDAREKGLVGYWKLRSK